MEITEEMKTPDKEKEMEKYIDEWIGKMRVHNEKIKSMMSNPDYLEWLSKFTQDKEGFFDDEWLYSPEQIKDSDRKNVEKLCLFYEGIEKYAGQNHIYPLKCEFGNFYRVRMNEIGFEIGNSFGQGGKYFCKKVAVENEQEFIDFNYIMTGKKQENVYQINANLAALSNMILNTYESGVPIQSIVYTFKNTINEISSQKEDKQKSLIKK